MKRNSWIFICLFAVSCTVTFITGYDQILDETTTKIKRDFNLFWIKFDRTLRDTDSTNQRYVNFLNYYDELEVDLITLKDRANVLPPKSALVRKQVNNLDSLFHLFIDVHKKGIKDINPAALVADDKRDYKNAINSSLNAVIRLQQDLKNSGKIKSEE
jgi:hypothetical protein